MVLLYVGVVYASRPSPRKKICRLLDAMSRLFEGAQEIGHQYFVGNCRVSRIRESAACEVEFAGICKHCTYVLASIAKRKKYVSWATGCVLDGRGRTHSRGLPDY